MRRLTSVRRSVVAAALALAPLACQEPLSIEPQWVQWFSYRYIHDVAVAPSGEITVVGSGMGDELTLGEGIEESRDTWRPFVAHLDAEGTLIDDWVGYEGAVEGVALDDEGRAYLVIDELPEPEDNELRALDHDGSVRWSKRWDGGLWPQVIVVDDVVVVWVDYAIEAFDLDGRPRWQEAFFTGAYHTLVPAEDGFWVVDQRSSEGLFTLEAFAWHYDARSGTRTEWILELPEPRMLGTAAVTSDGHLVVTNASGYAVRLSSLSSQGELRWDREASADYDEDDLPRWVPYQARVIADGPDVWIVGTQTWLESAYEAREVERHRLWLQRWSAEGEHEATFDYAFEDPGVPDDPDPDVLARADCITWGPDRLTHFGSSSSQGLALPDGSLLVMGQQGCRDAFLLRLAVDR